MKTQYQQKAERRVAVVADEHLGINPFSQHNTLLLTIQYSIMCKILNLMVWSTFEH